MNLLHPISNSQWGFQSRKSTTSALLQTTHKWLEALDNGKEVGAVFFDLHKAFDSVPHRALLEKLKAIHLNEHIIKWICSYLTNRKQHVIINGESSPPSSVISGVPQGSVLGPLLFIIYINDLAEIKLSSGSHLTVYADDILLYKEISDYNQFNLLQNDIDAIAKWVTDNHLKFSTSKCKFMLVSTKRNLGLPYPTLSIRDSPLENVDSFKYLGVEISNDLSWSKHIKSICTKARKLLGLLYRKYYRVAHQSTLLRLYLSIIRPHLEYASPVWSPHLQKDIDALESVQKFALRICAKRWDQSYAELLDYFSVMTLTTRRTYMDLVMIFKIIHKLVIFQTSILPQRLHHHNLRSQRPSYIQPPKTRTNYFYKSFIPRTVNLWNYLPIHMTTAQSLQHYKELIRAHVH